MFTTTAIGAEFVGLSTKEIQRNPALLLQGLPYALSLVTILSIQKLGYYFTTRYYQIPTTLPYLIPAPFFLGTLGAFIQKRSPPPHRRAIFDMGMVGSLAGLLVTL
ncbi:MAG: site-2 protease family protein, partial [Coleofasciculaceae cyanobacterium SM2_1_6]|nr:site-2 protease family protein [Coleofasciculaceae cyanobacterium SM2_1_6]